MRPRFVVALCVLLGLLTPVGLRADAVVESNAAASASVEFVADAAVSRVGASPWVVLPSSVAAGDRLVLILSVNAADRGVSAPTGGPWTPQGNLAVKSMRTLIWSRVATAADAGARVDIALSASAKSTVQVAAYRGVDPGGLTVASKADTTTSTVRTTPVASAPDGAWVLSYWASRSASTTTWTAPPDVTARQSAANSGSGRIASLIADSGAPVVAGGYGNLAATSDATSSTATTWTVVLPVARAVPPEPVAAFTHGCEGLVCSFDATSSSGGQSSLTDYDWTFGDGRNGTGSAAEHTYASVGTYVVVLTVTDADGATASMTHSVVVAAPQAGEVVEVTADAETDPVATTGDAMDDPAVWVHPTSPDQSLVIGNDKSGALEVYDLDGSLRQRITTATSFWGNVDVRRGVTIGGRTLDVVVAYNAGLRTFTVDPVTRLLEPVGDGTGAVYTAGGEGLCAYLSARTGDLSVIVVTRPGRVRQYRIHDADGDGLLQGTLVREFFVGSESEGCAADDVTGRLYLSEEDVGLWRYGAEPDDGATRTLVDSVQPGGNLASDVEGVTLAETGAASGYVLVSAQNGAQPSQSYFAVYDRQTNAHLWTFRVSGGARADGCERTDGIAAQVGSLGPAFPGGVFVCQDNGNTSPAPGNQNLKLTRIEKILPGS